MFVIDILRATTSMCAALHNGARALIPVASTEEALRLAQTIGSADVLLAGEKECVRIPGFHLGNSPLEMTDAAVRGKTLVVTTSNGTQALLACQGAAAVYPACAANLSLAAEKAREALDRGGARSSSAPAGRAASRWTTPMRRPAGGRRAGDPRPRSGLNDAAIAGLDLVRRYGEDWERPLGAAAPAGSCCSWASATTSPPRAGWTRIRCCPISTSVG